LLRIEQCRRWIVELFAHCPAIEYIVGILSHRYEANTERLHPDVLSLIGELKVAGLAESDDV
jgi:hypothetical protein